MSYSQPWFNEFPDDPVLSNPDIDTSQRISNLKPSAKAISIAKTVIYTSSAIGAGFGTGYEIAQSQDNLAGRLAFLGVSALGFAVHEARELRRMSAQQDAAEKSNQPQIV